MHERAARMLHGASSSFAKLVGHGQVLAITAKHTFPMRHHVLRVTQGTHGQVSSSAHPRAAR